jgi:hypothetical protein
MRHAVLLITPWSPPLRLLHAAFALMALLTLRAGAQDDLRDYHEGGTAVAGIRRIRKNRDEG